MKCNIKGCNEIINVKKLKVGQTLIQAYGITEVYCTEAHWQQHLKEVMPHN